MKNNLIEAITKIKLKSAVGELKDLARKNKAVASIVDELANGNIPKEAILKLKGDDQDEVVMAIAQAIGPEQTTKILKVSVSEGRTFSKSQVETLRKKYGAVEKIDPSTEAYKKLRKSIDEMGQEDLKMLADAKIKWISMLATNTLRSKFKMKYQNTMDEGVPPTRYKEQFVSQLYKPGTKVRIIKKGDDWYGKTGKTVQTSGKVYKQGLVAVGIDGSNASDHFKPTELELVKESYDYPLNENEKLKAQMAARKAMRERMADRKKAAAEKKKVGPRRIDQTVKDFTDKFSKPMKRPKKDPISAGSIGKRTDSDEDKHIFLQLRSAEDVNGNKVIKFRRGEAKVDIKDIKTVLNIYDKAKPDGKRYIRIMISKSAEDLKKFAEKVRKSGIKGLSEAFPGSDKKVPVYSHDLKTVLGHVSKSATSVGASKVAEGKSCKMVRLPNVGYAWVVKEAISFGGGGPEKGAKGNILQKGESKKSSGKYKLHQKVTYMRPTPRGEYKETGYIIYIHADGRMNVQKARQPGDRRGSYPYTIEPKDVIESFGEAVVYSKKTKDGKEFQVIDRNVPGKSQDKFKMQVVYNGKVVKDLGSHPSLAGAKKFGERYEETDMAFTSESSKASKRELRLAYGKSAGDEKSIAIIAKKYNMSAEKVRRMLDDPSARELRLAYGKSAGDEKSFQIIAKKYGIEVGDVKRILGEELNEVLKPSDPIEKWIKDFVHSKDKRFEGKSKEERIKMAKGAWYGAQKEEYAVQSALDEGKIQYYLISKDNGTFVMDDKQIKQREDDGLSTKKITKVGGLSRYVGPTPKGQGRKPTYTTTGADKKLYWVWSDMSAKEAPKNMGEAFNVYTDDNYQRWPSDITTFGLKKGYKPAAVIGKNARDMVLFDLIGYDAKEVKGIKLKSGEKIYRYSSAGTMAGGYLPYVKVNLDKGLVYYLDQDSAEGKTDEIKFQTVGQKQQYVRKLK